MKYYMRSKFFKIKEDFWIKDENHQDAYFVDNNFLTFGLQFNIIQNNSVLYFVREKLATFMNKYEVFENDKVVARINQKLTFFKERIEVESKYGDLEIVGSIFDYNYNIYQNGVVIATAKKEFLSFTDNYFVDINFKDEAFILCLVVIIDNIIDKKRSN